VGHHHGGSVGALGAPAAPEMQGFMTCRGYPSNKFTMRARRSHPPLAAYSAPRPPRNTCQAAVAGQPLLLLLPLLRTVWCALLLGSSTPWCTILRSQFHPMEDAAMQAAGREPKKALHVRAIPTQMPTDSATKMRAMRSVPPLRLLLLHAVMKGRAFAVDVTGATGVPSTAVMLQVAEIRPAREQHFRRGIGILETLPVLLHVAAAAEAVAVRVSVARDHATRMSNAKLFDVGASTNPLLGDR